jgi:hypothetical protein
LNDLSNEDVMTFLFYAFADEGRTTTVKLLSEKLVEARRKKLPSGTIPIRPAPNGYYSDRIAEYAALLLEGGLAQKKNPVVITSKGRELLAQSVEEIKKRNPEQARAWLSFLST